MLDFVQRRLQNKSPGDHEGTFIKAGDSETKEGFGVKETTGESPDGAVLASRNVIGKKGVARGGLAHGEVKVTMAEVGQGGAAVTSPKSQRREGPADGFRDELPLPTAPLVASLMETLRVQEKRAQVHD